MSKSNNASKKIYLDYASSALFESANPGAIHELGVKEKDKLENARKKIAKILNAHNDEIIFTSGATESNNLAILGLVNAKREENSLKSSEKTRRPFKNFAPVLHIVTTNIEHASVLETCRYLERTKQVTVTCVEVEKNGIMDPKKIKKALTKNTVLVSVMYANNEIGTIQPIQEIAKEIRHYNKVNNKKIFLHSDATQAINYLPINTSRLCIDLMSFNAAKIYGPKGVGILYIRKGTPLQKIMFGGDQEKGLRPGTENVLGATALASALETAEKIKEGEVSRLVKLRDYFFTKLQTMSNGIFDIVINGDTKNRLPNNINITLPNIPSDLLVIELSANGVMVSSKSACKSGDGKASHVIQAIRVKETDLSRRSFAEEDGSLRFSLGRYTTKADIDYTVQTLSKILQKLKKWYN